MLTNPKWAEPLFNSDPQFIAKFSRFLINQSDFQLQKYEWRIKKNQQTNQINSAKEFQRKTRLK